MLFYSSRQTNQIRRFNFWENLLFANLVFNFIWPLGAMLGTLKHWSRCQRLVEHLSFHMKYLERKFDKTNFVSPKKTPPKSPQFLGLIRQHVNWKQNAIKLEHKWQRHKLMRQFLEKKKNFRYWNFSFSSNVLLESFGYLWTYIPWLGGNEYHNESIPTISFWLSNYIDIFQHWEW